MRLFGLFKNVVFRTNVRSSWIAKEIFMLKNIDPESWIAIWIIVIHTSMLGALWILGLIIFNLE